MNRPFIRMSIVLLFTVGLSAGCSYLTLTKKDEPPPLPPIEETKPPLKMKSEYFKTFPWSELAKPKKDGNDPDTTLYTAKEGDTLESIAENMMGAAGMATDLGQFNDISTAAGVRPGDKVVIPNPIIGVSSQIMVKGAKEKKFGDPQPFDTEFKKGDQYKLVFETNVNGYFYVLREGAKEGVTFLYPAQAKVSKRTKKGEPLPPRDTGKVDAHQAIEIPIGTKGFVYDATKAGDRIFVFLCLRRVPQLDDLKDKKKIRPQDVEDVMQRVKEGFIVTEGPVRVIRITDPSDILGFALNING